MGMKLPPDVERRVLELAAQASREPHRLGLQPLSEKAFMAAVLGLAKREGWRVMHITDSRKSAGVGYPDLTMVHPARGIVFGELKFGDGVPTAAQLQWLDDLRAASEMWGPPMVRLWTPADWCEIERVLRG